MIIMLNNMNDKI